MHSLEFLVRAPAGCYALPCRVCELYIPGFFSENGGVFIIPEKDKYQVDLAQMFCPKNCLSVKPSIKVEEGAPIMTRGQKQEQFSRMIMLLMLHLHSLGYSMRGEHWLRCKNCPVGISNSLHKQKLAFDITLSLSPSYEERPRVLTGQAAKKAHSKLHDYWDAIGGASRIEQDLNHYSFRVKGVR